MLNRKLPSCACISVLSKFTVPTTLGTLVALAVKIPDIIKTANDLKKQIPAVQGIINDIALQSQGIPTVNPKVQNVEVKDMG